MNRRKFLKSSGAFGGMGALSFAGGAGVLSSLAAQKAAAAETSGYKAIVCVFLFGGQDGHDTVLPYDLDNYNRYTELRGGILGQYENLDGGSTRDRARLNTLNPDNTAQFGGREFALPDTLAPLRDLFASGDAAIVGNVGPLIQPTTRSDIDNDLKPLPRRLFSHNDQQSTWLSSSPEGEIAGWGGRFADRMLAAGANQNDIFTAISTFGNTVFLSGQNAQQYSLSTEGPPQVNGLRNFGGALLGTGANSATAVQLLEDHYRGLGPQQANLFARDVAAVADRAFTSNDAFRTALDAAGPLDTQFPRGFLGSQLRAIAETINIRSALGAGRQVFFAAIGGFDTHSNQAARLSSLQAEYAAGIAAFHQATVDLGVQNDVTLFTASDFGRSLLENGDGTDHGWGSHHFVVGGGVQGRNIYGEIPLYDVDHDYDSGNGRLIPNVAVEQYAATLGRWFGLSDSELLSALPDLANFDVKDLGFMGAPAV